MSLFFVGSLSGLGGRYTFDVDKIRRQCLLSYESGIDAVSMFGENCPYYANSEFNYLAFEYFTDFPHVSMKGSTPTLFYCR